MVMNKIRNARRDPPEKIREFHVPKGNINFNCTTYTEIINWEEIALMSHRFFISTQMNNWFNTNILHTKELKYPVN